MKLLIPFIFISFMSITVPLQAKSIVVLNSLNYPVWIERQQKIIPLAPGDELNQEDIVKTGSSGRAWLTLADGSVVKLGQAAQFAIREVGYEPQDNRSLLKATLDVIKGAFRFTTSFFNPDRKIPHQVNIKIGAITAGLRGTDVWGRSTESEDFVTLLEGEIEVTAKGEQSTSLSEPFTLYLKKRDQPADPITRVDINTVSKLGAETELSEELGVASINGEYDLVLMSLQYPANLDQVLKTFRQDGYAVAQEAVEIDDQQYTRLLLKGLVSRQAAENLSQRLIGDYELPSVWIKKRDGQ
jgi:hypothetical protein